MPTTFTHDVFGKEVFSRLSEELKQTIRQGKDLYRIGCMARIYFSIIIRW